MPFVFKGKHLKEAAEARRCWLMSIGVDLSLNILNMLKLQPKGGLLRGRKSSVVSSRLLSGERDV